MKSINMLISSKKRASNIKPSLERPKKSQKVSKNRTVKIKSCLKKRAKKKTSS